MPNQNNSIKNITAAEFDRIEDKDSYLSEITGLPKETVKNINQNTKECLSNIKESFPELDQLTKDDMETIFSGALNVVERTAGGEIGGGAGGDPCADCKKNGRIAMLTGTFFGIRSCPGNIFTMWFCGTAGFYVAAEATLACLRANNCR